MTSLAVGDVVLTGSRPVVGLDPSAYVVTPAESLADLTAYRRLRREVFVAEQGLFDGSDTDDVDDDPRTQVLLARTPGGDVLGGVRLHPTTHPAAAGRDIGWWSGSRLAVVPGARGHRGVGAALVRAACARAEAEGVLRFDAVVQERHTPLFARLGWQAGGPTILQGQPHRRVDWPIDRVARLVAATKADLGGLLDRFDAAGPGGAGFVGDDAAPVPGADLVAACDAILPAMVERDPEWAGWCSVLVNLNDLAAMGATPVGLLDAVGARDASFARRVVRGLADAARAWGVPVLGGHTQLGVHGALSVTALGRTHPALPGPVRGGGGRAGDRVRLTADLGGGWRPGYDGRQWDSTSRRSPAQLRAQMEVVPALAPQAAKDVSMSGMVGTLGMLAEASGCRGVLDVADVPMPAGASTGDWLTCFPGFAMLTAHDPGGDSPSGGDLAARVPDAAHLTTAVCGDLAPGRDVGLRWPDGVVTEAVAGPVTGMGVS